VFAVFGLGVQEIVIIAVVGVLLFGRKLPDVGRYLGKGIVEFKKGIKGLEDDIEGSITHSTAPAANIEAPRPPQRVATTAPKFEDNTSAGITPPRMG
jgi:sec-independent protein translocase protein TatA